MASYIYNKIYYVCAELIPVDSIYKETQRSVYNIMNGMTSKILNTTGIVDAQYCHTIATNKEIVFEILSQEQNQFKREKLAHAITEMNSYVINEMIDAWVSEKKTITNAATQMVVAVAAVNTTSQPLLGDGSVFTVGNLNE